ncbi:hypothetical protein C8J56DRAFT_1170860 [Mycena floridula]|nr:hypothetical protein C8J56DRAFT_1170860 [Mycena floridula]
MAHILPLSPFSPSESQDFRVASNFYRFRYFLLSGSSVSPKPDLEAILVSIDRDKGFNDMKKTETIIWCALFSFLHDLRSYLGSSLATYRIFPGHNEGRENGIENDLVQDLRFSRPPFACNRSIPGEILTYYPFIIRSFVCSLPKTGWDSGPLDINLSSRGRNLDCCGFCAGECRISPLIAAGSCLSANEHLTRRSSWVKIDFDRNLAQCMRLGRYDPTVVVG